MTGQNPGYEDSAVVGCQLSVYPLRQEDIDSPVQAVIKTVAQHCSVRVGNLSTLAWGEEEEVFAALRAAFHTAKEYGPAVLTATLAAGLPTDRLVADIQASVQQDRARQE